MFREIIEEKTLPALSITKQKQWLFPIHINYTNIYIYVSRTIYIVNIYLSVLLVRTDIVGIYTKVRAKAF